MTMQEVEGKPNGRDYPDSGRLPIEGEARAKAIELIDEAAKDDPNVWQCLSELAAHAQAKDDPNVWQVMSNTVELERENPALNIWKLIELLVSDKGQSFLSQLALHLCQGSNSGGPTSP